VKFEEPCWPDHNRSPKNDASIPNNRPANLQRCFWWDWTYRSWK